MSREETLDYLKSEHTKGNRLVIPRYNDGEYLLMNKMKGHVAQTELDLISLLLKNAIRKPDQLVCINYLKPHNIQKKDVWYKTQQYLIEESKHPLYGCGNWSNYDFCNNNELLPKLFSGKTLLIAGLAVEAEAFFKKIQPDMDFILTPSKNAVTYHIPLLDNIEERCNDYENILFACGPIGKVLIADLANNYKCNLIDLGAVLNAILNMTDKWPMSWVKEIDLQKQVNGFCEKLERK